MQDFAGYNAGSGSVTVTYPPSSPSSSPSSGTKDFSYTGTPQLWTVPAGVTSVQVDVRGAQGGGTYGGFGGRVVTTVPVIPGQVMVVDVGGQPSGPNPTGFDGGAGGGGSTAGAGGDATDVRLGGMALADRVVVAGGGGGQGPRRERRRVDGRLGRVVRRCPGRYSGFCSTAREAMGQQAVRRGRSTSGRVTAPRLLRVRSAGGAAAAKRQPLGRWRGWRLLRRRRWRRLPTAPPAVAGAARTT